MRVGIIDDDIQFLRQAAQLLKTQVSGCEVFPWSTVETLKQQMSVVRTLTVLIVDLNLPSPEGIKLIYEVTRAVPEMNCLILTNDADETSIMDGLAAGAVGYIAKADIKELGKAVKDVAEGKGSISPVVALRISRMLKTQAPSRAADFEGLTPREQEILDELSTGATAMVVSEKLEISFDTVRTHIKNIYKKFGVHSRFQLIKKFGDFKS